MQKRIGAQKRLGDRRGSDRRSYPSKPFMFIENPKGPSIPGGIPGGTMPKIPLYKRADGTITTDTRVLVGRRGKSIRPMRSGPEERRMGREKIQIIGDKRYVIVSGNTKFNAPAPSDARTFSPQTRSGKLGSSNQSFIDRREPGKARRSTDKPSRK